MKTMLMIVAMALSMSGIAVAEETTTDEFGNTYPAATVPAASVTELQSQLSAANAEIYELRLRLKTQESRVAELATKVEALKKENATLKERAQANAKANPVKPAEAATPLETVSLNTIIAGMPADVAENFKAKMAYLGERCKKKNVTVSGTVDNASVEAVSIKVAGLEQSVSIKFKQKITGEQLAKLKHGVPITLSGYCPTTYILNLEQR